MRREAPENRHGGTLTAKARGVFLTAPGVLEERAFELPELEPGRVIVRVAGCGLCHTDISFYSGAVKPRHPLPLVLGHEIAGVVEAATGSDEHLVGEAVLLPAVVPCGRCALCREGRDTACTAQFMPGNDGHGGFATAVVAPASHLVRLGTDLGGHALEELAVVADAVTTPYQALRRGGVVAGDLVVIVGVGGIGTYGVQIGRAFGAEVAAIDVDAAKRERARSLGARWVFDPRETDGRAIRKALASESGIASARWKIFEMSGTAKGQELAWSLLAPAATLGVIGFTMDKLEIRLSNLMALDATAFGSWGCSPRHYPAAVELVRTGRVAIKPFIESRPLSEAPALCAAQAAGRHSEKRIILVP